MDIQWDIYILVQGHILFPAAILVAVVNLQTEIIHSSKSCLSFSTEGTEESWRNRKKTNKNVKANSSSCRRIFYTYTNTDAELCEWNTRGSNWSQMCLISLWTKSALGRSLKPKAFQMHVMYNQWPPPGAAHRSLQRGKLLVHNS